MEVILATPSHKVLLHKILESNEQNKVTNKMEPEAWIHGTDRPVPEGRGVWVTR